MCVECKFESSCLDAYEQRSKFCNCNKADDIEEASVSWLGQYRADSYPTAHSVLVVWVSPFGTLEKRSGAFEEYAEAERFAKELKDYYTASGMVFTVYLDGNTFATKAS